MIVEQNVLTHPAANDTSAPDSWHEWQLQVLSVIRADFRRVLDEVEWDDIDWEAWRPLYEQGSSPRDAVRNAFGRVA